MPQKTYDESFWNQRYAGNRFVYGTEPNSFLAEHSGLLTGPVLSLSEGEGRNAVFLAALGLDVLGVDISSVGLEKASQLARDTGGPKDADMLMTVEKIRREFSTLEPILLRETERNVSEGEGHTGIASVVQFVARRLRA